MKNDTTDIQYYSLPQEEHNLMQSVQIVQRAKGPFVWMEGDPMPYTDFVMGYSAANFGHLNDDVVGSLSNLQSDNVVFFATREKEELVVELGKLLGMSGKWNFYFPVGGSMAVEAAARACLLANPDGVLLSFKGAFHGYGGVSRALTDEKFLRPDVFMTASKVVKALRPIDTGSVQSALDAFEQQLTDNNIAGVFIEPIQGAAGFIDMGAEFLTGLRRICTAHKVPLVCDEIQAAMFRCGELSVSLARGVQPDILLLGKSIGGGVAPISAVIMNNDFARNVPTDHAAFDSTFSGWTVGVSAARSVVALINRSDFAGDVRVKGEIVDQILDQELTDASLRARVRRIGLAIAFDGDNGEQAESLRQEMLSNHVIIQTSGVDGSKCKMSPCITIDGDTLTDGIRKLAAAIKKVCA